MNPARRRGRMVRGRLIERHGTRCVFQCPAGHRSSKDYGRGPIPKRIGESGLAMLERYWRDGISYECAPCARADSKPNKPGEPT